MPSSLTPWLPVALVTGWVLGLGTAQLLRPSPPAVEQGLPALEALSARIDALPEQVARLQVQTRCAASASTGSLDSAALRAELRTLLREELGTVSGKPEAVKAAPPAPPEQALPPASLAALERGQRLLDDALRTRRWGDSQAEELRRLSAELPPPQRLQLLRRLFASINRGDLVVETTARPY